MLQFYTIGLRDSVDCGNLKECIRPEFFRGKIHLASAESLFVRETDMGAHGNIAGIEEGYTQALRKHSGDYSGRFCFPKEAAYRRLLGIAGFEVEQMEAFDRPTPLAGGREGLRRFAEQFFAKSLHLYREDERAAILDDLEQACEDDLWDEGAGCWVADYRRLRFTARKVRSVRGAGGMAQLSVLGS